MKKRKVCCPPAESFMRRSAARCRMASGCPGRRRIVIRSTAGDVCGGKSGTSESSNARIALSADSDTCRLAAASTNKRFTCGVGRVVIDEPIDFKVPSVTARQPMLRQIADISLSCHHKIHRQNGSNLIHAAEDGAKVRLPNFWSSIG